MSSRQFAREERWSKPYTFSWTEVRRAWRRYRSRQRIAELNGHLLKDIGISFSEAEAEANKPFWRY